ncbi:hypothetical protein UT300016_29540 [Clostridium senegalense]
MAIVVVIFAIVSSIYSSINKNLKIYEVRKKTFNYTNTAVEMLKSKSIEDIEMLDGKDVTIYFNNYEELTKSIEEIENYETEKNDICDKDNFTVNIKINKNINKKENAFCSYNVKVATWKIKGKEFYNGKSSVTFDIGR